MINLALVQFRPQKGSYRANLARLDAIFAQLGTLPTPPDVVMFPKSALTGYFLEGGVRDLAVCASDLYNDLQAAYLGAAADPARPLDIVIGFYERHQDRYYNSALYATLGRGWDATNGIAAVHRKVFLPTYGVFDEARFVENGHGVAAFDTRFGRVALLICEDAWHSLTGTIAALDGAQLVYIVSASPARNAQGSIPGNIAHWEMLLTNLASEHGIYVALAQLTGFEGGKAFAGGSLVMNPRGEATARGPLWDEAIVTAEIDLRDLHLARADLPLLADTETLLPFLSRDLQTAGQPEHRRNRWQVSAPAASATPSADALQAQPRAATPSSATALPVVATPRFDPNDDSPLQLDAAATTSWLVSFLQDEVTRRRGFNSVVLGLSGGVNSALVAYLCAQAFGSKNVYAIRMPYRTSSSDSLDHAQLVADALGINCETIEISDAVDGYLRYAPDADARRRGNIMARQRMIMLFDQSARRNCITIGTGNKTERMFGYYTWHADDSPPVNPLGDLWKTQVWQLAEYLKVPGVIVQKPASADLIKGQTDESDFGISYPKADRILHYLLQGYTPERLVERGFAPAEVEIVVRRVSSTHWKRHLPSVAMLSSTAIGEYYLRPVDY